MANSMAGGSIDTNNYLTIYALEDGLSASLSTNACEYCVDGDGNWLSLAADATTQSVNTGQTLSFRGNLIPTSSTGIGTFTISKRCNLEGNCMSMLFGDDATDNYSLSGKNFAFYKLFRGCNVIVSVSENFLPATELATYCYHNMFYNCSALTITPSLPATTLGYGCYGYMFYGCIGLTTSPELPATELADSCYSRMFFGCVNLTTAPELPAITLANNCYEGMFNGCSGLIVSPTLAATTLTSSCYYGMFNGCSRLNYIKMLATDISASNCLFHWVSGVASAGTFVKNASMTTLPTGVSGIPSGWTVINDGEDSKTINYIKMFYRETGPDEYMVHFYVDIAPHSDITISYPGSNAWSVKIPATTLTGSTNTYCIAMSFTYPTIENFTVTPNEDDMYIYKIVQE